MNNTWLLIITCFLVSCFALGVGIYIGYSVKTDFCSIEKDRIERTYATNISKARREGYLIGQAHFYLGIINVGKFEDTTGLVYYKDTVHFFFEELYEKDLIGN